MMRKLLLFFAMLCVSIGAWAMMPPEQGFEMKEGDIGVWFAQTDAALTPEKVIKIEVTESGGVKAALDELALILGGSTAMPHYANFRAKLDEAAQGATDFIADNRLIVKIVYTGDGSLTLSDDDKAALNAVTVPTIDLQDLKPASAFTLSNSNVKNLILPDEWTMAQVQAAATGCSNLNAALSIGTDVGAGVHADGTAVTGIGKSIVAYVNKPGTLYQSTRRLGYLDHNNDKVGSANPYNFALSNIKLVTITGTPSARDFNGSANTAAVKFDADGHFVFDKEADETSVEKDAAVGGGSRQLLGTTMTGALSGTNLTKLDLGDAIITDEHYSDLTISWSYSCVATSLKEIIFPTTSQLTKLPADCLNGDYSLLEELCIPGNIKVLKTRACFISTNIMRHVWTTGGTEHMIYDNGAYLVSDPDNVDHYGHAPLDDTTWNAGKTPEGAPRYGTITLPEGLELIESHNFTARSVSDVYVLNVHAPECHVDAFSTIMYLGNNTIDTQYILDQGMVTRQAYAQSVSKGEYITFLHYPRQSTTPDIQRYTDVTREYSVATTLRDGKGNVIYFPNQSELNRAYLQGTTGYLWYAWDSERVPGPAGNENSFANFSDLNALTGHTTAAQQAANGYYLANTMTDPDKTDRSFYDVRLNSYGEPTLDQPSGLDWYYNTVWEGSQLYPQMETTQTTEVIGERQSVDSDGDPIFEECGNGNYVKDFKYVADVNGGYVQVATVNGYQSTQTPVEGVSTYYSDQNGTEATPKVQNGYFVEDGVKNIYAPVDKNSEAIGARDQYYTKNGDTYTESNLRFYYWGNFQPLYYGTDQTEEQIVYTETRQPVSGVSTYYDDVNGSNVVTPTLDNTYYFNPVASQQTSYVGTNKPVSGINTYYLSNDGSDAVINPTLATSYYGNSCETFYYNSNNEEVYVTTYDPSITDYYVKWSWGNKEIWTNNLEFANTVYYKKTETVYSYSSSNQWQGDITYYVFEWRNNVQDYYETTPSFGNAYYYVSSTETVPVYGSSDYYIAGKTWYTYDSNNKTYTLVTLDWNNYFGGEDYYYVSGTEPNYSSADGQVYNASTTYYTSNTGAEVANPVNFNTTYYYPTYDYSYVEYTGQEGDRYRKKDSYREWTEGDGEVQRYCPVTEPVYRQIKGKQNDYRGWHQFVLTAYATNDDRPFTPVKFYQTDNDWWTVCLPYDLKYNDMIKFFGNETTGAKPYLSKLRYVVRDYDKEKITLMFSKNLMVYKEVITNPTIEDDYVHGVIDDVTTYTSDELAANPVILHKGVPYLIKPNIPTNANRSFDVYLTGETANPDLYQRLVDAQNVGGGALETYIYKGEYTVPAYVIGENIPTAEDPQESRSFTYKAGPTFTYTSSDKFTYGGKEVSAKVSGKYSYTFVGSFFLSLMPKDCYFLGWDSKKKCAAFWFNKTPNLASYDWNNQTGIICPNFDTSLLIDPATSLSDPAKWTFAANSVENDNLVGTTSSAKRGLTDMDWGEVDVVVTGIGKVNVENNNKAIEQADVIYDMQGVRMNRPLSRLPKGVYIVNGKKYVVD